MSTALDQTNDFLAEQEEYEAAFLREMGLEAKPDVGTPEYDVVIDRALERIADAKREIAQNDAVAERRMQMIRDWRDEQNVPLANQIKWAERTIRSFAECYDFGKKKSRTLPHGKFGFQLSGGAATITDMGAAVAFAVEHGIEVKTTVGVAKLKEYIESTGEVLPFVVVEPKSDHFYVKAGE